MRAITLTQGHQALIDDEDFDFINPYRWTIIKPRNIYYAKAHFFSDTIYMHIEILKHHNIYIVGLGVDHKDHNGLNNQKENLRMSNQSQNVANGTMWSHNTSGFRGVCFHKGMYYVKIKVNQKTINLGSFSNKHDAAFVYNCYSRHYFGEFGYQNEINRD